MANKEFEGKKLLILGGNAETVPLVRIAQDMGVKCIVASSVHDEPAKAIAWKASDVDGMDVPGLVELANNEKIDGVLVGVADMLVPFYCKVCEALDLPCYATDKIVNVFAFKDEFKATCEHYGIHGIPEFTLDKELKDKDIEKIKFPVMVKPVDSASGQGIVKCSNRDDLLKAVPYALSFSKKKRFIVERFMDCDDMGMYYTFKDGECSINICLTASDRSFNRWLCYYVDRIYAFTDTRIFTKSGCTDGVDYGFVLFNPNVRPVYRWHNCNSVAFIFQSMGWVNICDYLHCLLANRE